MVDEVVVVVVVVGSSKTAKTSTGISPGGITQSTFKGGLHTMSGMEGPQLAKVLPVAVSVSSIPSGN